MQGNDFVQSAMYKHGVTCFDCHDVHGTPNNADLIKPVGQLCLTCHGPASPNGPHAPTSKTIPIISAAVPAHSAWRVTCRRSSRRFADINVRSHTFAFIPPSMTDEFKMPNSCTGACHLDKTTDWARQTMRTWSNVSPWRVQ
jgi:predicted CXXCH cytochrome family protein